MRRRREYRNIFKHISTLQLIQPDEGIPFSQRDLFIDLTSARGTSLFLGSYSKKGITHILELLGIFDYLEGLGLRNVSVEVDTSRVFQHIVRLYFNEDGSKSVLAEVVMRRGTFSLPGDLQFKLTKRLFDIFVVEWVLLQNTRARFTRKRPQLPGQDHPGLGLGNELLEILYWLGRRAKADGILIVPNYLHAAIMYSRGFYFVNPEHQGMLVRAKKDLLKKNTLAQVTWACKEGKIINSEDGTQLKWKPSEMILPVSRTMHDYFYSNYYRSEVKRNEARYSFAIEQGYRKEFRNDWSAA